MKGMMSGRRARRGFRRSADRGRGLKMLQLLQPFVTTLVVLGIVTLLFQLLRLADRRMMPMVMAIAEAHMAARTNAAIQAAVAEAIAARGVESADFYTKTVDAEGRLCDLAVNTVLVNAMCAELAVLVAEGLSMGGAEGSEGLAAVEVPVGMLLGVRTMAHWGPRCRVLVRPVGAVQVEYETSFEAAGVNQVNFQIWLRVEVRGRVVNPLGVYPDSAAEVRTVRRVALVNVVFAGEMPGVVWGR